METIAPHVDRQDRRPHSPPRGWQVALAESVRDPAELCRRLRLPLSMATAAESAAAEFGLLVPQPYLGRIRPGDPEDPLLRQILPRSEERIPSCGYTADPVGDSQARWGPGLLRKYRGRTLMVATGGCAVHCRFCFRRHFPFDDSGGFDGEQALSDVWGRALDCIAAAPTVREVVLSGGDPLTLPDDALAALARRLAQISHVKRLRIHTRMPIMVPQRVTDALVAWLRTTRLTSVVVVHVNHPGEIDEMVAASLGRLVDAGVPVLSQSVLLRAVNDRVEVLAELFERLIDLRVMPYYLHQLDPVAGAAHFEVPVAEGRRLIEALRARLPGYAVPRYVRETPGGASKEALA